MTALFGALIVNGFIERRSRAVWREIVNKTLDSLRVRAGAILAACALLLAGTAWADPPGRVVRLAYVNGPVSFLAAGDTDWVQAAINRPLWTGDRLWTGSGARASLAAVNASTCRSYSRTRYDPGVHTAIIKSTSGRPSVGYDASTST